MKPVSRTIQTSVCICVLFLQSVDASGPVSIDRFALAERHCPALTEANPLSPLSVGNGEFAFTADVTGLQTYPEHYLKGTPLGTLSSWGWHTIPSSTPFKLEDAFETFDTFGRDVPYASKTRNPAGQWLRANPHRLHLGRIGFHFVGVKESSGSIADIEGIRQTLDLWKGLLHSSFQYRGIPVQVTTGCHPERDLIAVRVKTNGSLIVSFPIKFDFPYGSENWGPEMCDWNSPEKHRTTVLKNDNRQIVLERTLDNDVYYVRIAFSKNCEWKENGPHSFFIVPERGDALEFVCEFSPNLNSDTLSNVSETFEKSEEHWKEFWSTGGAIDLSECSDPRAPELERRIVLSQYLTAIQCASSSPPQESGLTHNSWYGKCHLEMHWWHAVHFALWDRTPLLEKSVQWYEKIMPQAKSMAKAQGYDGARWPKMAGPDGREGPSGIGVFLIWQQPHPIYYAELCYRAHPNEKTLNDYKEIVFQTAEFMASYAHLDKTGHRYYLGPPLIPAQECYPPRTTFNPTYELAYWAWGLECAQQWKRRLELDPDPQWQDVIDRLSPLPMKDGVYVTTESTPDTFENAALRRDHPSLVGALGVLPGGKMVDRETMRRTLHKIFGDWNWESTWGWDYPMLAMTAARVGEPELAIQSLLLDTPKNHYLPNGHCYQRENLPTYLPANGGLLTAAAMMAAGWDGVSDTDAPGFPKDGKWNIRWENLRRMP